MPPKDKPLQLRTVDDSEMETAPAVRLDNRQTEWKVKESKPVRLGLPAEEAVISQRLSLPDRAEIELRTHQPGIDHLVKPEPADLQLAEQQWGGEGLHRQPIPWGWFVLIGLVITGALLWSLNRVDDTAEQTVRIRSATTSALVNEEQESLEAAQLIDRIDKALRLFVNATSVDSLSRLARHSARVTPLMHRYYADQPVYCGPLRSIQTLQPITLGNRGNFWVASVALSNSESRSLLLEIGEDGEPRIDWETFVGYQPMAWDDFARQRPAGVSMDFRVYLERDNFYSHEFADSDQWVSFRLTALDSQETLFGYSRAGSAGTQELLRKWQQNGGGRVSLILRLGIPEGLQSRRGVVIEKLVCDRWVYLDPPDSGS